MKITITTLQLQCGSLFVIVIFLPITVNFNSVFSLRVWLEHPEIFRPLLFWGQPSNCFHSGLCRWSSALAAHWILPEELLKKENTGAWAPSQRLWFNWSRIFFLAPQVIFSWEQWLPLIHYPYWELPDKQGTTTLTRAILQAWLNIETLEWDAWVPVSALWSQASSVLSKPSVS